MAVPTTLACEGQDQIGRMLDGALGAGALVASQSLHITSRPAPPRPGPMADTITRMLQTSIYPAQRQQ